MASSPRSPSSDTPSSRFVSALKTGLPANFFAAVKRAFQVGALDEEIIHEQLPADVDGDHLRRTLQIRHRHRLGGVGIEPPRRPLQREFDAVVEDRLRTGRFVRQHLQLRVRRDELARQHIFLAELRQQDFRVGVAVPVVEDVDQAVRAPGSRRDRRRSTAFIEQQAAAPGLAIVVGEKRRHVRPLVEPLVGRPVLHQQQPPRRQPPEEEAGVDVLNGRSRLRLAPGAALIGRKALVRIPLRPREHPQAAVAQLDQHVLVELPIRELDAAAWLPRSALIGRGIDPGGLLRPVRHRQEPVAVFEHGGFVQRAALGESTGSDHTGVSASGASQRMNQFAVGPGTPMTV